MYVQAGWYSRTTPEDMLRTGGGNYIHYESNQNLSHPGRKFIVVDAGGKYIECLLYNNMHCISVSLPPPPPTPRLLFTRNALACITRNPGINNSYSACPIRLLVKCSVRKTI